MKIILVVYSGTKWGLKSEKKKKNVVVLSSTVTIYFFFLAFSFMEQIKEKKRGKDNVIMNLMRET